MQSKPPPRDGTKQTESKTPGPRRSQQRYVEAAPGWRFFFFSVATAAILGLGTRLYFNPNRVRAVISSAIADQPAKIGLSFGKARLELANGSVPQVALVLSDVALAPAPECRPEASMRIATLRVPFRVSKLLRGQFAVGSVEAEDMVVDLDGLKARCETDEAPVARANVVHPTAKTAPAKIAVDKNPPKPWWTPEQLISVQSLIGGVELSRVELQFENRTKKVFLESFSASSEPGKDLVRVETDLRIPPEIAYGERIPVLNISMDARATAATVAMRAELSEGSLTVDADLTPGAGGSLETDTRLKLENVPLSQIVPLLSKAGVVKGPFKPKFLWLNCNASINGRFQGLFERSPLKLDNCIVDGTGARIAMPLAVRRADGIWDPFKVSIEKVDLERVVETFGWKGPDGVVSKLGRLSGEIDVRAQNDARFEGKIEDAEVFFSSLGVRANQKIPKLESVIELKGDEVQAEFGNLELEGGAFEGKLAFDLKKDGSGKIKGRIETLRLSERVQQVLVRGRIGSIKGDAEAQLSKGKLSALKGDFEVARIEGNEVRIEKSDVRTELAENGQVQVTVKSPLVEVNQASVFFRALEPAFFAHRFAGPWIAAEQAMIVATFQDGNVRWEKAQGEFESGKIKISSEGSMTRARELSGWLNADYPSVKKLKWDIAGTLMNPTYTDASKALADLRLRPEIGDKDLGLPSSVVSDESAMEPDSFAAKTSKGLRDFGARFIRRARGIIPSEKGPTSQTSSASEAAD